MVTNVFKTNRGTIESGFSGNNETRFYDPEIEKLFTAGLRTLDRDERREIYKEIVQRIHFDEIPVVKLQTMPRFMGASDKVQGLLVTPAGYPYLIGNWEFDQ
jgi:ABC-type transport system substrate-binding protein